MKDFIHLMKSLGHNERVSNHLSSQGILWHFNPPSAPHFGGLWEAGVKSVKFHLRRVIGATRLTFEEFSTVTTQIEGCLDSRPLTPLTTNSTDLTALTPAHFLIGDSLQAVAEPDVTQINENRLSRWQLSQRLVQHFWKRWSREFLTRLQQRPKWMTRQRNIQVSDMVLIQSDGHPPTKWPLARVLSIHPGDDGLTRVVTVRTQSGEVKRPITKLCLLPLDISSEDDDF